MSHFNVVFEATSFVTIGGSGVAPPGLSDHAPSLDRSWCDLGCVPSLGFFSEQHRTYCIFRLVSTGDSRPSRDIFGNVLFFGCLFRPRRYGGLMFIVEWRANGSFLAGFSLDLVSGVVELSL